MIFWRSHYSSLETFSDWTECDSWCGTGEKFRYTLDDGGNEISASMQRASCEGNDLYCGLSMAIPGIIGLIITGIIYYVCRFGTVWLLQYNRHFILE